MQDVVIIGGGMAGLSAAIYASRARLDFKIISSEFGGQFLVSGEVLNYPGLVNSSGIELMKIMKEQMKCNKVNVSIETAEKVEKSGNNFIVKTDKNEYTTRAVIIATGSRPRRLDVKGEKEFERKGVTYCAICDGPLFSGKDIAVVGSGASALEAVDFMENIASNIYLLVRGDKLKGHKYLQERAEKNKKLKIFFKAVTKEIIGDKFVNGIRYEQNGKIKELKVHGVVVETGRIPNTELFRNLVKMDDTGHVIADFNLNTNVPGIFAAGDITSGNEYQYSISAGQGVTAMLKAIKYISESKTRI